MNKIKIFINTYKNEDLLKNNIDSLLTSDVVNYNHEIIVINNYTSEFNLQSYCDENNIKVLHNYLRPDFSTGHLSRNWNQAIINGFKSLQNPDCDILVLVQNDNLFLNNWCSHLIELHNKYEFISMGAGDQFHSYKAEHIKKVGLWDERFCNIGYQEYDYFTRCFIYNKDKSSINDPKHKRTLNEVENNLISLEDDLVGGMRNDKHHLDSLVYHNISKNILINKWGEKSEESWNVDYLSSLTKSFIPNFIYYPYFEKDIDYSDKNYII
jgi:hypothetical protein